MEKNIEISTKEIFKALSKPLRIVLSIAISMTGLSAVGIIGLVTYLSEGFKKQDFILDYRYLIWFLIFILLIIISLLIIAFSTSISLIKTRMNINNFSTNSNKFEENCKQIDYNTTKINSITGTLSQISSDLNEQCNIIKTEMINFKEGLEKIELSEYILDCEKISKLEAETKNESHIIVMTSKFQLDKHEFLQIILDNIRKGITYEYLIPGASGEEYYNFKKVYQTWWRIFCEDLFSREHSPKEGIMYCSEYNKLKEKALDVELNEEKKMHLAKGYFISHINKYIINAEHNLVTIIMYQQTPEKQKKDSDWRVILKLPTESGKNKNYYAFELSSKEPVEKQNLVNGVLQLCLSAENAKLELDNNI